MKLFLFTEVGERPSVAASHDEMDPKVKMDLEYILEKNLKQIMKKYASYVDCLRAMIKGKGVTPEDLRAYLLSLPTFTKGQKLSLLSDKEAELEKCNTIATIFTFLTTKCASFLNYDIFQDILENYDICQDREKLKYQDHLRAYIEKHKISEFIKINPLLKTKGDSTELTLKYDIESTCRLAKVNELKKLIADILDLNPSALCLCDIKHGCVIVTFHIPASVADIIFTPNSVLTIQQEDELRSASILWIKCNGHTFHIGERESKEEIYKIESLGKTLRYLHCTSTCIL